MRVAALAAQTDIVARFGQQARVHVSPARLYLAQGCCDAVEKQVFRQRAG